MLITLLADVREGVPVAVAGAGFEGSATWLGPAEKAGAEVDVELKVRDEVDWAHVIVVPRADDSSSSAGVVVRGVVVDVDQDDVLTLRVGDGLVLIGTRGEPPLGMIGRTVLVPVRGVEIVPTGV